MNDRLLASVCSGDSGRLFHALGRAKETQREREREREHSPNLGRTWVACVAVCMVGRSAVENALLTQTDAVNIHASKMEHVLYPTRRISRHNLEATRCSAANFTTIVSSSMLARSLSPHHRHGTACFKTLLIL